MLVHGSSEVTLFRRVLSFDWLRKLASAYGYLPSKRLLQYGPASTARKRIVEIPIIALLSSRPINLYVLSDSLLVCRSLI